jgi:hypothetical protein
MNVTELNNTEPLSPVTPVTAEYTALVTREFVIYTIYTFIGFRNIFVFILKYRSE